MAATDREQQILAWIKQNPLISQNELAELCGITRSGVAAHISNLMKKGYIQGKGYIVTPPSYVAVVGAINIDHYGVAMQDVVGESSNMGRIVSSVGGIGYNIAYNLTPLRGNNRQEGGSRHMGNLLGMRDVNAVGIRVLLDAFAVLIITIDGNQIIRHAKPVQIVGD